MKKIGIFSLGARRENFMIAHATELSKCKYDNFHFYILSNGIDENSKEKIKSLLKDKVSFYYFDPKHMLNYMMKVVFAINQGHEYSIKHDEDCFMVADAWDKFFKNIEDMQDDDLITTGALSTGIPTVEMFLNNHTPEIKNDLYTMFNNIKLNYHGADYTSLNKQREFWSSEEFYTDVKNFDHFYKGIHPVRVSFECQKKINDYVVDNFELTMKLKDKEIIKDKNIFPYYCNSIFGIKTENWKKIVSSKELFVDNFDEVPLNRFRIQNNMNIIFDTGIPIIHTMYNWCSDFEYEKTLIQKIINKVTL